MTARAIVMAGATSGLVRFAEAVVALATKADVVNGAYRNRLRPVPSSSASYDAADAARW